MKGQAELNIVDGLLAPERHRACVGTELPARVFVAAENASLFVYSRQGELQAAPPSDSFTFYSRADNLI